MSEGKVTRILVEILFKLYTYFRKCNYNYFISCLLILENIIMILYNKFFSVFLLKLDWNLCIVIVKLKLNKLNIFLLLKSPYSSTLSPLCFSILFLFNYILRWFGTKASHFPFTKQIPRSFNWCSNSKILL